MLRLYYLAFFVMMGIYVPYFPAWLRAQGFSGIEWSVVGAILPLASIVSPPLFGVLADALGLRGLLLRWAALGATVCFAALTLAVASVGRVEFPLLFALVCGFALCRTPMHLIADVLALAEGTSYGRIRLWGSIGFLVAAPLVGWWLPLDVPVMLPLAITLACGAAWVVSHGLPRTGAVPGRPVYHLMRQSLRSPTCRWFLAIAVLGQGAHAAYDLCVSLYLQDRGASSGFIGLWWSLGTMSEVALMAISPWLLAKFRVEYLLLTALLVGALRWGLLASHLELWWLFAAQPLHAITFGLRWVACMQLVQRLSVQGNIATLQGLYVAASAVGGGLGMVLWGSGYDLVGGQRVYWGAAGVSMAAAALVLPLLRSARRHSH